MSRTAMRRALALSIAVGLLGAACGTGDDAAEDTEVIAEQCIVRLHGKGGSGSSPELTDDGVAILNPDGNGSGWGARQWDYDSADEVDAAVDVIAAAADGATCTQVVVHGFSNGASMAAALACSGEHLDDRLVGVIIDDPVTDAATEGCPPLDIPVVLYWTGALDETAPPGTECESVDWTCDGAVIRGIDAYASDLDVSPTPSPFDEHRWYLDTPVPATWLG